MKLVSAMCPNCGAQLELDENMEKGFCMYCGSRILVQDDAQKYKPELSGQIFVQGVLSAEELAKNGETFMKAGNIRQAYEAFRELSAKYPDDFRGWWGLVRAVTSDFSLMPSKENYYTEERETAAEYFDHACKSAGDSAGNFKEIYEKWDRKYSLDKKIMEFEAEYGKYKPFRSGTDSSQLPEVFTLAYILPTILWAVLVGISFMIVVVLAMAIMILLSAIKTRRNLIFVIIAVLLFYPAFKVCEYALFKFKERMKAIDAAKQYERLSPEMKERMEEIEREYSDISE